MRTWARRRGRTHVRSRFESGVERVVGAHVNELPYGAVRTVRFAALVPFALAAVLTGCGNDDDDAASTTTPGADIAAEVDAICEDFAQKLEEHGPMPYDDFDPENPDPALLPQVGAFFAEVAPAGEEMVTELEALETDDSTDAANLEAFIAAVEADLANALTQQEAAKAADVNAFVATLEPTAELAEARNEAADALGATACTIR